MVPKRRRPCGTWTRPLATISSGRRSVMSRPPNRMLPWKTRTSPESAPRSVDFPAPFAPINATSARGCHSTPTSNSPGVAPKPAVTSLTCSSCNGASAIGRRGTFAVRFALAPGVALAEVRLDDPGVVEDLGGWTFDERPSEIKDQRVGAHSDDHAHDVFDEHDRDPTFPHPPHHRECLLYLDVVEPGHHLIQQQQPRTHGEGAGNLQAFAVRDGEAQHGVVPLLAEPHQVENLVSLGESCGRLQPPVRPAEQGAHGGGFANGHGGEGADDLGPA